MSYKHIYQHRAEYEYDDALNWYLERSLDAGIHFAEEIAQKLKEICLHPTLYRKTKKHFREAILKKYAYSIIYRIAEEENLILIVSVFHHSRKPGDNFH